MEEKIGKIRVINPNAVHLNSEELNPLQPTGSLINVGRAPIFILAAAEALISTGCSPTVQEHIQENINQGLNYDPNSLQPYTLPNDSVDVNNPSDNADRIDYTYAESDDEARTPYMIFEQAGQEKAIAYPIHKLLIGTEERITDIIIIAPRNPNPQDDSWKTDSNQSQPLISIKLARPVSIEELDAWQDNQDGPVDIELVTARDPVNNKGIVFGSTANPEGKLAMLAFVSSTSPESPPKPSSTPPSTQTPPPPTAAPPSTLPPTQPSTPSLEATVTAQSTLPPVDVLPEMKIRETYVFKIGDTLESIASNFGITTRELLLVNNNIRWEHDGLDGFELKIPEKLSDQNLNMFYEIDFKLAPDLQGYSKNRDNEHRFVFYINKETGKTDRVMDLQTSKIYGYAKAKDNTVLLTDEVLLQEKGLLYPGYYDHGGTLDKAVETWKDQQIKSRNPYGLSKDTSIEIEVRFSDPDTPWGQQKITNYSDGTFFGIWYAWTKNGSFRLITYVSPNNEAFVGFIFRTLQYTTPNRITLADKWLAKLNINPGYPEYDIEIGYRPPGKIITEETYPIGIKK